PAPLRSGLAAGGHRAASAHARRRHRRVRPPRRHRGHRSAHRPAPRRGPRGRRRHRGAARTDPVGRTGSRAAPAPPGRRRRRPAHRPGACAPGRSARAARTPRPAPLISPDLRRSPMKFTNGYWLIRDGVTLQRPAEVHDVEIREDELVVHAPVTRILSRGDTLNKPVISVSFTAPRPDVIAVKIEHFAGRRESRPRFELESAPVSPAIARDPESQTVEFTSGRLTARVALSGPWHTDYLWDGELLTSSTERSIGYAQVEGEGPYVHEQLSLDVGEHIYGLGERFGAFVKNGQSMDIWNAD